MPQVSDLTSFQMKVVLLGSGNVATHLAAALKDAGNEILQVWSRNSVNAELLASRLNSSSTAHFSALSPEADIYILAVSDDAIPELAGKFPFRNKLLVHTSGTTDMEALKNASTKIGVLYPLQTFSKSKSLDFAQTPIALEANSPEGLKILEMLVGKISRKVMELNSQQRRALHIAAVFACNFGNHLYTLSKEILRQNSLEFDLIRPLIIETASKVQLIEPEDAQTGPAVRGDYITIDRHLEFLQNDKDLRNLYELFTESIISKHR